MSERRLRIVVTEHANTAEPTIDSMADQVLAQIAQRVSQHVRACNRGLQKGTADEVVLRARLDAYRTTAVIVRDVRDDLVTGKWRYWMRKP